MNRKQVSEFTYECSFVGPKITIKTILRLDNIIGIRRLKLLGTLKLDEQTVIIPKFILLKCEKFGL